MPARFASLRLRLAAVALAHAGILAAGFPAQPLRAEPGSGAAPLEQAALPAYIAKVRAEIARLDQGFDTPREPLQTRRLVELPHWQLRALYEAGAPKVVYALFTQGRLVRDERYYFGASGLLYVAVEQSWDDARPGERSTKTEYFLDRGRIVRSLASATNPGGPTRSDDRPRSADALTRRADALCEVLAAPRAPASARMATLEAFPSLEP